MEQQLIGLVAPVHTAHHPHNTEQYGNTTNSSPPPPHWPCSCPWRHALL